jgi:hypothetical protein
VADLNRSAEEKMNLQQKRYPFGSVTYSLTDTMLFVEEKRFLGSRSFEVPLRDIGSSVSKTRQFPLGWCIVASLATAVALGTLVGVFVGVGDTAGMLACVLMSSVFSALAWHGFFERKIDLVILHARDTGYGLIFLQRTKPSVRHVEEFVQIVKERLESPQT